ncbi:MAG: phosphoglucosamine mutase [Bacteroidales bacterium]|nr:phosphoglucosamine mutase [Bacteroidales bacterium]
MTLIKSVSGIRGTIGGKPGDNLTPIDVVKFTSAYIYLMQKRLKKTKLKIIVGRDARLSGPQVLNLVLGTLSGMGADAVNIGLATTPTTEIAVTEENADGGIILTASHNPKQWNALKLLNEKGEFLSANDGKELLNYVENEFDEIEYAPINLIGKVIEKDYLQRHIELILKNEYVDIEIIKKANFRIVIDAVNSVGGIAIPALLEALGVKNIIKLYCEPTGEFPHNPEPLPENLTEISKVIKEQKADVGFVVDPDVDRLAIVNEDGTMFGEEYTLVAVADYILSQKIGNTVSNLSSTRALRDVTEKYGANYSASAVGEVNVVEEMKRVNAVIGGEGNGGVIFPELHYGRDSLIGIALFLSHLAKSGKTCTELRAIYPEYHIKKNKIQLTPDIDVDRILSKVEDTYKLKKDVTVSTVDGVKLDMTEGWVHLRKSNTEPIIRIYAESSSPEKAEEFAEMIMKAVKEFL